MKTAMILAAGRGERLRPLTDAIPKALCRVHNVPIIEYHIEKLIQAGVQRIVINHAHLGGKIRQQVGTGARWGIEIIYTPEPPGGLETAGGIVNALPWLGTTPFIAVNADIVTNYSFSTLTLAPEQVAHLVLIKATNTAGRADFGLSASGHLRNDDRQYTYSGIACYHPQLFHNRLPGRYSLTPILRDLAHKQQATGEIYEGTWIDIGSHQRLQEANQSP